MPVMKRATKQLQDRGISLRIKKGLWGYYLDDPKLPHQRSKCYNHVRGVIDAAIRGERPEDLREARHE